MKIGELIVCDSFSDDGSWEYISNLARTESRMRISQVPRNGIYAGFNDCIRLARGEYVYIATSDDTMSPQCIEKLVDLLQSHPEAGMSQCALDIIDGESRSIQESEQWENYTLGMYDRSLVTRQNIRSAPHDGLLHAALFTICTSVTQLLVRRSVFDTYGLFEGRWGAIGDFEWHMRVGLVEDCVFTPEKLATWRVHPTQATSKVHSRDTRAKMIEMANCAFRTAVSHMPDLKSKINIQDFILFLEIDMVELGVRSCRGCGEAIRFLASEFTQRPLAVLTWTHARLRGERWDFWKSDTRYKMLKALLEKYRIQHPKFVEPV